MPAKAKISGSVGMHRSEAEGTRERSDAPEGAARRCAGFPSPAEQYLEPPLDLNELLVKRPAATFFARVVSRPRPVDFTAKKAYNVP